MFWLKFRVSTRFLESHEIIFIHAFSNAVFSISSQISERSDAFRLAESANIRPR